MPSFTSLIEDSSPFLTYNGAWSAGSSSGDPLADRYTESSFMVTNTVGASMSFQFYGSSVSIFGSKRGNHGNYRVTLDDQNFPAASGASPNDAFNQTLFTSNVNLGLHNVTIINDANAFLDVDYVSYTTSIGRPDESLIVNTYQDMHPNFLYTPTASWGLPNEIGTFSGSSGRASSDTTATASFKFSGSAISIYGPVGPNHAQAYSVTLDNGSRVLLSANKRYYRSQQLLYTASNLGPGEHTVVLQPQSAGELAVDYANVYSVASQGGSFGPNVMVAGSSSVPAGIIAGLALTTTFSVLATLGFIYMFLVKRKSLFRNDSSREKGSGTATFVRPFAVTTGKKDEDARSSWVSFEDPQIVPFNAQPTYAPSTVGNYAQITGPMYVSNMSSSDSSSTSGLQYAASEVSTPPTEVVPTSNMDSPITEKRRLQLAYAQRDAQATSGSGASGPSSRPMGLPLAPNRPLSSTAPTNAAEEDDADAQLVNALGQPPEYSRTPRA